MHCCPSGLRCDTEKGVCQQGRPAGCRGWRKPQPTSACRTPGAVEGDVPCDNVTSCPSSTTCCRLTPGEWGCCPAPEVPGEEDDLGRGGVSWPGHMARLLRWLFCLLPSPRGPQPVTVMPRLEEPAGEAGAGAAGAQHTRVASKPPFLPPPRLSAAWTTSTAARRAMCVWLEGTVRGGTRQTDGSKAGLPAGPPVPPQRHGL